MKPPRRLQAVLAGLCLAAVTLAGCTGVRVWSSFDVQGADVQRTIDAKIVPALRAGLEGAAVARSRCPARMDVSFGRKEYCVIPIDRDEIPVTVLGGAGVPYQIQLEGAVYDLRRIARIAANDIAAEYGVRAQVDCGHGWRLLEVGSHLRCMLSGPPVRAADIEIRALSRIIVHSLPGFKSSPLADSARPYLARHRAHRRTIVPGSVVAPYIALQIRNQFGAKAARLSAFQGVRCPDHVDMSGTKRMICRLRYGGEAPRYAARIDDADGILTEPVDAILVPDLVRRVLLTSLQAHLDALGRNGPSAID